MYFYYFYYLQHFLKNYTVPFVQLDPLKTILVFSHEHNTFDKRKLLETQQNPQFFKLSDKTVDQFIRQSNEAAIKQFFMTDIDSLLKTYEPGEPKMKPDVLQQIKEIDEERQKMMAEQGGSGGQFMINEPGKSPRTLSHEEIAKIMNQQVEQITSLSQKNEQLEKMVANLQKQIAQNTTTSSTIFQTQQQSIGTTESSLSHNSNDSFISSLLIRINELEERLKSIGVSTETMPALLTKNTVNTNSEMKVQPIKSKSTPEVKVKV